MTLIIQKPTGGKLNLAQVYVGIDDPDAAVYVAAVEAADGQSLETATKVAIHSFVKGCKNDGIWPAIKASCILAGARTLAGALVPLVGAAPTNVGGLFVSGDYNRKTGLVGNGSTKYLNSNRNNSADPQDSKHLSVYKTSDTTTGNGGGLIGNDTVTTGTSWIFDGFGSGSDTYRLNVGTSVNLGANNIYPPSGFIGVSRGGSAVTSRRYSGNTFSDSSTSQAPSALTLEVFTAAGQRSNARLAFYSIGESLGLALLDARVTALVNAIGAAF